jgi:GT2 family glycosyltransferase
MVEKEFPSVELIRNTTNFGFVRANNQGAELANGRYLLLLNSDTVLLDGGIRDIINYFDTHSDVGVATGRVLNPDRTFQRPFRRYPHWLGAAFRHSIDLAKRIDHPLKKRFYLEHLSEMKECDVDWVTGAYLFLRRELMEAGRVFDEDLNMYYEDTLLCFRVRERGYRVVYLPCAPIIHYHGASAKQVRTEAILQSFKSSVIYFRKVNGISVARIYSLIVRAIWSALTIGFIVLQVFPVQKFREKSKLFRTLLSKSFAL